MLCRDFRDCRFDDETRFEGEEEPPAVEVCEDLVYAELALVNFLSEGEDIPMLLLEALRVLLDFIWTIFSFSSSVCSLCSHARCLLHHTQHPMQSAMSRAAATTM